jgi:hypothetical protein
MSKPQIMKPRRRSKTTLTLHGDEWEQLWLWHKDQQFNCAGEEDYAGAAQHKDRAAAIRRVLDAKQS